MSRASRHLTTTQRETRLQRQVAALRQDNLTLKQLLNQLQSQVQDQLANLQRQVQAQQQQITQLQSQLNPVKPERRKKERKPRAEREPQHNHARRREEVSPDQIVEHRLANCPDCSMSLHHYKLSHRHQVIEIAPPPPALVTEHWVYRGYCYRCQRWHTAQIELAGAVVGQARFGPRLSAWIGWLRTSLRLPIRHIQRYLGLRHNLHISVGGIDQLLDRLVTQGGGELAQIKAGVSSRAVVHADETGWREDGSNGYAWGLFTPEGERLFERSARRAGAVAKGLLAGFKGILASDFYGGYNIYPGRHQRCWVHLLRLLKKVTEREGGTSAAVQDWLARLKSLYERGKRVGDSEADERSREGEYVRLVGAVGELGREYAQVKGHALQATSKLLLRYQDELFEYVRVAGLAADNNLAERSIRPLTVARKVSGGTRSAAGSKTRMGLQSLFDTWAALGQDPLASCMSMVQPKTKTRVPSL